MRKLLTRRAFLGFLLQFGAFLAVSAVLTPLENLYRSWSSRRRSASAQSLFRALIPSALRSVDVVSTGSNAYLSPVPAAQWPELLPQVDQLIPYAQYQKPPVSCGTLQLLLYAADPQLPQPIRFTWLDEPSIQPRSVVYIGAPCDAAFIDATMAPWLRSFLGAPPVNARAT